MCCHAVCETKHAQDAPLNWTGPQLGHMVCATFYNMSLESGCNTWLVSELSQAGSLIPAIQIAYNIHFCRRCKWSKTGQWEVLGKRPGSWWVNWWFVEYISPSNQMPVGHLVHRVIHYNCFVLTQISCDNELNCRLESDGWFQYE